MKTQLLEDIGDSAASSPTPPKTALKAVASPAPLGTVQPAREAPAPPAQPPEQQPTPGELDNIFEEIAALEAQYVPPTAPAEPPHQDAAPVDEPTLVRTPPPRAEEAPEPVFDFTLPMPEPEAADPFTPASGGRSRSRLRYLVGAACVLAGALLFLGGRVLYQEHMESGSLARIADNTKEQRQAPPSVERQAVLAKELPAQARAEVQAPPAEPANQPLPAPPPEPEPSIAAEPEQPPPSVMEQAEPAPPVTQAARRVTREQSHPQARTRSERESARQLARAPVPGTERPAGQDTTLTATLQACRAYGYDAAQCVKRGCGLTRHGLVCRGR